MVQRGRWQVAGAIGMAEAIISPRVKGIDFVRASATSNYGPFAQSAADVRWHIVKRCSRDLSADSAHDDSRGAVLCEPGQLRQHVGQRPNRRLRRLPSWPR